MKKILIMTNHFYPEQFRINDIANEWINRGYDVEVVTQIPNYPNGKYYDEFGVFKNRNSIHNKIKVKRLFVIPRGNNSLMLLLNYISYFISSYIYALLTRDKPDLIFVYQTSPVFIAGAAKLLSRRKKIPLFINVLDVWPQTLFEMFSLPGFLKKGFTNYCEKIYSYAKINFVSSRRFQTVLNDINVDNEKIVFWPQYCETFYENLPKPSIYKYLPQNNILNLTFTGNIGEAQGLEILVEAAILLKQENIKVNFNIVGSGRFMSSLVNLINDANISDYFYFVDSVPATEVPAILAESDVALLTFNESKLFENILPAKLQSYMACGMPILAVASGEAGDLVESSKCGFVSKPGDAKSLAENIVKITNLTEAELLDLSKYSKEYSNQNFDKKALLDQIDSHFNGCTY